MVCILFELAYGATAEVVDAVFALLKGSGCRSDTPRLRRVKRDVRGNREL